MTLFYPKLELIIWCKNTWKSEKGKKKCINWKWKAIKLSGSLHWFCIFHIFIYTVLFSEDIQSFAISINRKFLLKSTGNNNSTKFILHVKFIAQYAWLLFALINHSYLNCQSASYINDFAARTLGFPKSNSRKMHHDIGYYPNWKWL